MSILDDAYTRKDLLNAYKLFFQRSVFRKIIFSAKNLWSNYNSIALCFADNWSNWLALWLHDFSWWNFSRDKN